MRLSKIANGWIWMSGSYLLDTNIIIGLFAGETSIINHLKKSDEIFVPSIALGELHYGARKSGRVQENLDRIEEFIINVTVIDCDADTARQYGDAKVAFKAAQKLFPGSNKPKQGLASVQRAVHNEKLTALTAEAQHFESVQDWNNAIQSYQQILVLQPDLVSAQQALLHNQQRENILSRLHGHINNKLRLSSDSVVSDAKQLLNEASLLEHPGSKIEQAAINLKNLLLQASKPISITLRSDNQTDVAIYKVGKLGKFSSLEIELKPGKYTIVGSRSGFRDVRKIVTVLADMADKTIQVHCDEPI